MIDFRIVCKASTHIGLGHLMRSKAFAQSIHHFCPEKRVELIVIGELKLKVLINSIPVQSRFISSEADLMELKLSDCTICFFDMLEISEEYFVKLKELSAISCAISPIFNHHRDVDFIFSRTQYYNGEVPDPSKFHGGLRYTIINPDNKQISSEYYFKNLNPKNFPIGVTMGGGDAPNRTLSIIEQLKNVKTKCTFWIMLGEGYRHSLDKIILAAESDQNHEIILAKNNQSIWKLLRNCSLVVTTSGISSYEAVYARIPTITFYENPHQYFLIKELIDKGVALNGGVFNEENQSKLPALIDNLLDNTEALINMHNCTKGLIDNKAAKRILSVINSCVKMKV